MQDLQTHYNKELFSEFAFDGIDKITDSIKNYAVCNHGHYFSYVAYRIWQAVCSIFGCSDWQIARNSLIVEINRGAFSKIKWLKDDVILKNLNDQADVMLKLMVDYYEITYRNCKKGNIDKVALKEEWQKAAELANRKLTLSPVLSQGIPNLGRTCYANAAAIALYPLKQVLLQAQDISVCDAVLKVYANPVNQASHMVRAFNDCMLTENGLAGNDTFICMEAIFSAIVKKYPELQPKLHVPLGYKSTLSELINTLMRGNGDIEKYLILGVRDMHGMKIDAEEFSCGKYQLKLLSACTGGNGHATTYIKVNDIWTYFDDNNVQISSPFGKSGFAVLILETKPRKSSFC